MASLHDLPGHLIRRLHQISVSTFTAETAAEGFDLTQVQYAALFTLRGHPGIDQATLAGLIAYDRVTIGGVVALGALHGSARQQLLRPLGALRRLHPGDHRGQPARRELRRECNVCHLEHPCHSGV